MIDDLQARVASHSVMDCLNRVLSEAGALDIERITIVVLNTEGDKTALYSNARSEAEMFGMLHMALNFSKNLAEDE